MLAQRPTTQKIVYPGLQLSLMILAGILCTIFLYRPMHTFRSQDSQPIIVASTPEEIAHMEAEHKIIKTHLYIYDAPRLHVNDRTYSFHGYIIFTYDPVHVPFHIVDSFDLEKGTLHKSKPTIRKHADGTESVLYALQATYAMNMDFSDYPLDDHRMAAVIINRQATPQEILYVAGPENLYIEDEYSMALWKDVGHAITAGYQAKPYPDGSIVYPAVRFSIDYAQNASRQTSIILLPMFIIFILTTFALSLDPRLYHAAIISVTTGGISALIAYRYVIENLAPKVGYFMLSDYLFFLFFLGVFANFIISMFIEQLPHRLLGILVIGQYCFLLAIYAFFILLWAN